MKQLFVCLIALIVFASLESNAAEKIKVLLVDGQNNHAWAKTSPLLKAILENAEIFSVDVATAPAGAPKPKPGEAPAKVEASKFAPKFSDYAVVVSNYNGQAWPEETRKAFVEFVKNGGGFVPVHAANNSFPDWPEYNEMIGLGGWGGRNQKSGPYLRLKDGKFVKDAETPGPGGGHGKRWEYVIDVREPEHPIMKGLPTKWKHAADELYHNLRGPANNITVLGSAFSDKQMGGTGNDEPLLMTISYEKGRVFHTALGHDVDSIKGLGFQTTFARGVEWAATGKVTLPAPKAEDLPADHVISKDPTAK